MRTNGLMISYDGGKNHILTPRYEKGSSYPVGNLMCLIFQGVILDNISRILYNCINACPMSNDSLTQDSIEDAEHYEKLETLVQKKDIKRDQIVEHDSYVKELTRYIISDLKRFRTIQGDDTLGGMVICETSEQARKIFAFFDEVQRELNADSSQKSHFKAGLILHDSDDKDTRKQIVKDFKKNMTIDILIVFNMLLTGFDAPRLKRLYFGRKLKDHNLLQAITRVNRPYPFSCPSWISL